jgi:predicted adenine nucleotide alpha hydrolase (AANH) superfamily ATPase
MRILAHICCAPCFTYPHEQMVWEGHDVTGLFYNPNIHPYTEFKNRMKSLEKYAEIKATKVMYINDYDIETYLRMALDSKDRCRFCYTIRLKETARMAKKYGFDAFTTTLLISPYQKHEMLYEVGKEVAYAFGIEFYYKDWRGGYDESRELARGFELYMQKYCGCIFSEKERYFS